MNEHNESENHGHEDDHGSDGDDHGHGHEIKIIVNGREKTVRDEELSFDEVVALAFDPPPSGPSVLITIAYRNAAGHPHDGSLVEGETVKVKDGTVFDVTATDKS